MSSSKHYIYLHGFASSPQSAKAQYFADCFRSRHLELHRPDLNQNDFYHLTLTRQLQQVAALLDTQETVIIGSSFGGLTAAWLAEQFMQIQQIVLLAPAFQFLAQWQPRLGAAQMQQWQQQGQLDVYHYGEKRPLALDYQFISDLAKYDETTLQRPVPTLILHGRQDEVIAIEASRDFAAKRSWVRLIELESDHALVNVQAEIWREIEHFCQIA